MTNIGKTAHVSLPLFLILLLGVHHCVAPNCFYCSSKDNDKCGDYFRIAMSDKLHVTYCDVGSCIKRRGVDDNNSVRRVEITRSCVAYRQEGCRKETYNGIDTISCTCNSEFCNSSTRAHSQMFLLFFSFICFILLRGSYIF
ncbi:uncharacterized protein LOC131942069 [Physella acuta]|uniref:uncharacterized protein LOC131942069 n=1 Tax=Physella acuta TaxID=109671 RepID=UPI0027DC3B89|nr:uncharacterized protein LOC131942069 [Physella acuta]